MKDMNSNTTKDYDCTSGYTYVGDIPSNIGTGYGQYNYQNCPWRLPCGICQRSNSICPMQTNRCEPTWSLNGGLSIKGVDCSIIKGVDYSGDQNTTITTTTTSGAGTMEVKCKK